MRLLIQRGRCLLGVTHAHLVLSETVLVNTVLQFRLFFKECLLIKRELTATQFLSAEAFRGIVAVNVSVRLLLDRHYSRPGWEKLLSTDTKVD